MALIAGNSGLGLGFGVGLGVGLGVDVGDGTDVDAGGGVETGVVPEIGFCGLTATAVALGVGVVGIMGTEFTNRLYIKTVLR